MFLPIAQASLVAGATAFVLRLLLATTGAWLLAAALTLLLRRSSASMRHRVWSMSMAAAFVIPPLLVVTPQWEVGHFGPSGDYAPDLARVDAIPQTHIVDRMPALSRGTEPESAKRFSLQPTQRTDDGAISAPAGPPSIAPRLRSRTAPVESYTAPKSVPPLEWLAGLWLIVALWLLIRRAVSMFIAAGMVRRAPLIVAGAAVGELKRLRVRFNSTARPLLRQSDEIRTPICVGCVRSCIVLPMEYAHWDREQLAAALTHELAHVVRRDVAWQTLARLSCAIYWFHPLVWIAAWRMRVERELACDDWVLRGGESPTRYARWLVDMAASLTDRSRPAERVGVAMARPQGFQTRLSAILDPSRRRTPLSRRATLLIAIASCVLLAPLAVLNPFASRHAVAAAPPPATQPVPPANRPVAPATQPAIHTRLIGNVVDAETGKPIEKFSVKVSVTQGGLTHTIDGSGSNGRYEVNAIDSGVCSFKIHVIADGYLRADDSGRFINYRGAVRCDYQFDARLIRGGASGSVLMPDGKPAEGVDVGLIDGVRWTPNISTVTDAAGRFMLPPRTGQIKLMLSHDSGWNFIKTEANAPLQNLPLRPWCRVEGVLMKGDKPWPRQTIDLRPTTAFGDSLIERQNYRNEATTDANGKFTIEHVIDGTSEVGVDLAVSDNEGRQAIEFTHAVPLNLKPGESKAGIQIGGTGRPIVGHVIVGNDLKAKGLRKVDVGLYLASPPFVPPPSYDSMSEQDRKRILQQYMQTEEHQRYQKRVKDFRAPVNADGSFRIEDVPAGDYTLYVAVWGRLPEFESYSVPRAEARLKVTVPDMPGGRSDDPLDVGPLDLKPLPYPEAGEMVPEFEGADFNKGRIKLSDYRGKYVLLNFWATGDTTSIEEFKKLEDLNQAYAADPRFVMIGVSLDKGADEPAKYLLDRKLPWPQAYGGRSVSKTFGILRVPSIWLIGPDGKIIARGGPDWYVDRAVKQALQTK